MPLLTPSLAAAQASIPGIEELWAETRGDRRIGVALLDGPVDLSHPCFAGADLTVLPSTVAANPDGGPACRHGTHLASVIFGQPHGLAPNCRGWIIPVFSSGAADAIRPCSELDLARAVALAVQQGASIINISGGQFSPSGAAHPLLGDLVRACARRGVLIVAAAGNDGCDCLHVPAAHESVLAVGAMDADGQPLDFSNWGHAYRANGILARGQDIVGALPGGGMARGTGTSYATAVVSGVAALLLSLLLKHRQAPDPGRVREALLRTAIDCTQEPVADCRRLLAGRLNIPGCVSFLTRRLHTMSDIIENLAGEAGANPGSSQVNPSGSSPEVNPTGPGPSPGPVQASACACKCAGPGTAPQLVYALGQLGYDFVSEARMDSIGSKIAGTGKIPSARAVVSAVAGVLDYLKDNAWDAAAFTWTLTLDGTAIYAIEPRGPFAAETYRWLQEALGEYADEKIERISAGGVLSGSVTVLNGQTLPVLVPEMRTMYSWPTGALVDLLVAETPGDADAKAAKKAAIRNFLDRVYHGLRNLGLTAQDRALNFAATTAIQIERAYEDALRKDMELDTIQVTRSPICRPGSDCWDVELYFFYPGRDVQTVRRVYRFTVDVSDLAPVIVGPMREWFVR